MSVPAPLFHPYIIAEGNAAAAIVGVERGFITRAMASNAFDAPASLLASVPEIRREIETFLQNFIATPDIMLSHRLTTLPRGGRGCKGRFVEESLSWARSCTWAIC